MFDIIAPMKRCFNILMGTARSEMDTSSRRRFSKKAWRLSEQPPTYRHPSVQRDGLLVSGLMARPSMSAALLLAYKNADATPNHEEDGAMSTIPPNEIEAPHEESDNIVIGGFETETHANEHVTQDNTLDLVSQDDANISRTPTEQLTEELQHASMIDQMVDLDTLVHQNLIEDYRWFFNGEDASDYAVIPARMVSATEGIKESPAILLDVDLSSKLQAAVAAQRLVSQREKLVERRKDIINKYLSEIDDALQGVHIMHIQMSSIPPQERTPRDTRELAILERESSILKDWADIAEQHCHTLDAQMSDTYKWACDAYKTAIGIVDDIFVNCNLIATADEKSEDKFVEDHTFPQGGVRAMARDELWPADDNDDSATEMRQGNDITDILQQDYYQKRRAFYDAEAEFEQKDAIWYQEKQQHERLTADNENLDMLETRSELDRRHLHRAQQLTRELIEAEQELDEAKYAALEEGVQLEDQDQESCFVDDVRDGYRVSLEAALMAIPSAPRIHKWVNGVSERGEDVGNFFEKEIDSWDAVSVTPSDSGSCVAEGKERTRIDRWNAACAALRGSVLEDVEDVTEKEKEE